MGEPQLVKKKQITVQVVLEVTPDYDTESSYHNRCIEVEIEAALEGGSVDSPLEDSMIRAGNGLFKVSRIKIEEIEN